MFLLNFAVLLSALTTLAAAGGEPPNVSMQLMTSADMKKLLQEYPDAQPLSVQIQPEKISKTTEEVDKARTVIVYTLGQRVFGDTLVSSDFANNSWGTPQDVRLTITYPAYGVGAIISYLEIEVYQSSDVGSAVVIAGGIGQRFITIAVEARSTYWFNYSCYIFGY